MKQNVTDYLKALAVYLTLFLFPWAKSTIGKYYSRNILIKQDNINYILTICSDQQHLAQKQDMWSSQAQYLQVDILLSHTTKQSLCENIQRFPERYS